MAAARYPCSEVLVLLSLAVKQLPSTVVSVILLCSELINGVS